LEIVRDCDISQRALKYIEDLIMSKKGVFKLALSGGRSPKPLLQALRVSNVIDWSKVEIFMVDDRVVPPAHPKSNYLFLDQNLIRHIDCKIYHGIDSLEDYSKLLEEPLDLIILGLGEDGHTASIFPDADYEVYSMNRKALKTYCPRHPYERISMSLDVINTAKDVFFFVTGSSKLDIIKSLLNKEGDFPAEKVKATALFTDLEF